MAAPIGLIAGEGRLPVLVAQGMRRDGHSVMCVAFRGHAHAELRDYCDHYAQVSLYRPGGWIRRLRRWGASDAVMIGRVDKTRMHDPFRVVRDIPDWRAIRLWYRRLRHDRGDAAVLAAVADELALGGVRLIDSTTHLQEHLATQGVMGGASPSSTQLADIAQGWPVLQQVTSLGVGQCMAIREGDIIAVEAVEGTDRMIDRAGELCRATGWTLLKTASDNHDRRADVPTIGPDTITRLRTAGCGCVAIGANRVLLADRPAVIAAADAAGIAVVGIA